MNRLKDQASQFIFDPLNAEQFKKRMDESFSPVYLTSISIIQGVAFGFLCQQTFTPTNPNNQAPYFPRLLYAFASFIIIVCVSYEYNWFVGIHRWSQKFLDTLIPFLLGFWQIGAIFNLSDPVAWWLIIAAFNLSGAFAFWNTFQNCRLEMFTNKRLYTYFKLNIRQSIIAALAATIYSLIIIAIYHWSQQRLSWYTFDLPAVLLYIASLVVILRKDNRFITRVHKVFHFTD